MGISVDDRRLRSDILLFFPLAYAISWTFWFAIIAFHLSAAPGRSLPGRILYFAGIQGPFLAGLVLSLTRGGWPAVRRYYATIIRRPVNALWIVSAVLGPVAVMLIATWLSGAPMLTPWIVAPPMGWGMLVFGQLLIMHGEEYGWRGFALPRMEKFGGTLGSALVLGVLWAFWHLPLFFTSGSWQSGSIFSYVAITTASCIIQAMFFFRANRSTLAGMLYHGSLNTTQFILNVPDASAHYIPIAWAIVVIAAIALMPRPWFRRPQSTA